MIQYPAPIILPPEMPPLPRPRFTLSPAALIVLAFCALSHVLAALLDGPRASLAVTQDLGTFALGFLVCLSLAWLAWRVDPRRQAGTTVFCCLLLLFAAGRMSTAFISRSNLRRPVRTTQTAQNRPAGPARDEHAAPAGRSVEAEPPAIVEAREVNRKALAVTRRVMLDYQSTTESCNRAAADLQAAGYASVAGLDSREAIARRRMLVQACARTNDAVLQASRNLERTLHAEMARVMSEDYAGRCTAAAMEGVDLPLLLRIRDDERRLAGALDGLLMLYDAEFTHWRVGDDKRIVFDDPGALARQRYWVQQTATIAKEEHDAQEELIARKKSRMARQNAPTQPSPGS